MWGCQVWDCELKLWDWQVWELHWFFRLYYIYILFMILILCFVSLFDKIAASYAMSWLISLCSKISKVCYFFQNFPGAPPPSPPPGPWWGLDPCRCLIGGSACHLTRALLELGSATHRLTTVGISILAAWEDPFGRKVVTG